MPGKAPPSDYYASANNNGSATPAVIAEAEPLNAAGTNIDNTNGAARFYCSKCRAVSVLIHQLFVFCVVFKKSMTLIIKINLFLVFYSCSSSVKKPYDLPNGASSWRCSNCGHFNSTTPDQM